MARTKTPTGSAEAPATPSETRSSDQRDLDLMWEFAKFSAEAKEFGALDFWLRRHEGPMSSEQRGFLADLISGKFKRTKRHMKQTRDAQIMCDLIVGRELMLRGEDKASDVRRRICELYQQSLGTAETSTPCRTVAELYQRLGDKYHLTPEAVEQVEKRAGRRNRLG
jgi:hypothetical protein